MLVAAHLSVAGWYLLPVFKVLPPPSLPPQTIILLPVQTAVWNSHPVGALRVLMVVQLFEVGLYRPPVFKP